MSNQNWFLVLALSFMWGSSFYFAEVLLNDLNPFMIVFLRVFFAWAIFMFICGYHGFKNIFYHLNAKSIFSLFVMGILNNVIPFCLIVIGQETITSGLASILNSTTAFFSILVASWLIKTEKLTLNRFSGVLIGLLGVSIAIGITEILNIGEGGFGKYLIILATLSYAFAGVWGKKMLRDIRPRVAATGMLTSSSLIMACILALGGYDEFHLLNETILLNALVFAVLSSVIAYMLYFKILKKAGPGNLSVTTIIIPLFAVFLDTLVLQQYVALNEILGFMVNRNRPTYFRRKGIEIFLFKKMKFGFLVLFRKVSLRSHKF